MARRSRTMRRVGSPFSESESSTARRARGMIIPQHVTALTKTTGHGGQIPDTMGNDFRKTADFFIWSER